MIWVLKEMFCQCLAQALSLGFPLGAVDRNWWLVDELDLVYKTESVPVRESHSSPNAAHSFLIFSTSHLVCSVACEGV
jgi:hypothetical protein